MAAVRAAAVDFAEPLVQNPEIKPVLGPGRQGVPLRPARGTDVNAPTVEILADFLRLIGKEDALAQMQERGTLQETADWLDAQFATFRGLLGQARPCSADAWDAISARRTCRT